MPSVTLIHSLPKFVSPEEHTALVASTPNSFADIPPVLRHKEENVTATLDPPFEAFSSDQGTLYVLTSVLVFMATNGTGFQIEYPMITLHAVSRGESGPSIYCQLDESVATENGAAATDDDEGVTDMRELTLFPQNPDSLETIFESLSQCASLHPDPQDDEDENDMLDDAFIDPNLSPFEVFNGNENDELSEVGKAALAHLESIIYDPHNLRPEDVEEEEEEAEEKEEDVKTDTKDVGEKPSEKTT